MKSVPHDRRGGLSIVEVLISLSISAMLLVAVAAAFSASSQVIQENDEFFRATQAARVSLNQMLTEIRRCSALTVDASGKRIDLITDDGEDRSYVYDDSAATVAGRRLLLVTNDITTDPDYTMAENVSMLTFSADTLTNDQGIQYVVRVTATIEVQVGNNSVRLAGSTAPRRVHTY